MSRHDDDSSARNRPAPAFVIEREQLSDSRKEPQRSATGMETPCQDGMPDADASACAADQQECDFESGEENAS